MTMNRVILIAVLGLFAFAATPAVLAQQDNDPRAGVFSSDFPWQSRYVTLNGNRIHYIDEGEGDTFVFLHGNPTSMYLWRNVMRYVEPHGRIVAMDNLGFGGSDQPQGLDYTFQMHYEYLEDFIEALDLQDIILVVHDWGSVLGLNYARLHENNVAGVVFMEAIIAPRFPIAEPGGMGERFRQFRDEEQGRELLIGQNVFIEQILLDGPRTREFSEAEKATYRAPFTDPDTRFPIYMWPNELPIGGVPARNVAVVEAVGQWLRESPTPKLLQYVQPGALVTPESAAWMAEHFRTIETQFVGYGGHYLQEDAPQAIGRGIVDWHRRLAAP
jgi:haloalkane dehalogenase